MAKKNDKKARSPKPDGAPAPRSGPEKKGQHPPGKPGIPPGAAPKKEDAAKKPSQTPPSKDSPKKNR